MNPNGIPSISPVLRREPLRWVMPFYINRYPMKGSVLTIDNSINETYFPVEDHQDKDQEISRH